MEVKKSRCERITFPRKPNYVITGDYQASKLITRKLPKLDDCNNIIYGNVAVSRFRAHHELQLTEKRLKDKRKFESQQRKTLDAQWEELSRKEEELKQSFIEFNQFIKDNEAKRQRALSQLDQQNIIQLQRDNKIRDMRTEYHNMKEVKKLMEEAVEKYKIYEDFLEGVVEKYPEEFKTINDVIKRYEALIHAKNYMIQRQIQDLDETGVETKRLHSLTESCEDKIETLQMKAAILGQRYESVKIQCSKWENILQNVKQESMDRFMEFHEVKSNCLQMYLDICKRTKLQPIHVDDVEKQLGCIKKALGQFECLNRLARAAQEEERVISVKVCLSDVS